MELQIADYKRRILQGQDDVNGLVAGDKVKIETVILAGGGGTRLWPKSRNATPKQFLSLFNKDTLTQVTVKRLNRLLPWERIFCVTVSEDYKKEFLRLHFYLN